MSPSRANGPGSPIIDLHDLNNVKVLYRWQIENVSLHRGLGGLRAKYFKLHGRYYVAVCIQFAQGTPDADLGAIIFDVTGLPDTSKVKVVARIRAPETPGGFHNLFAYKHSDGRVLLFTTTTSNVANVYDMDKVLAGDTDHQLIGTVPVPPNNARGEVLPGFANVQILLQGYHDFYVGYDPATCAGQVLRRGRWRVLRLRCHASRKSRSSSPRSSDLPGSRGATRSRRRPTATSR